MKNKLTLQQKLAKRKWKKPNRLIHGIYHLIMSGFVAKKYNPHYEIVDDINKCEGGCFLIWNHLSRLDHAFVMQATYPRPINILAGYNEFFRSHLHFVFGIERILPKKNFTRDSVGLLAIDSIIKAGGCVAFSPEGMSSIYGQNQPIVPGTGKMFKHYKVPVYFVEMQGSYLTSTKVCLDERLGRVNIKLTKLFSPEQLASMTGDEIDTKINEVFRHDEYEWNKVQRIPYKNKGGMANRLNDLCYKCPKCGKEFTMATDNNTIKCSSCGNGATINEYYDFVPLDDTCVLPSSPAQWFADERQDIIKAIRKDDKYSLTTHVKLGYLPEYEYVKDKKTSEICGEGDITFDHSGIHYVGTRLGEKWTFDLSYSVIYSLVQVVDMSKFALYVGEQFYEFYPNEPIVGKILLIVEEMHRLHFNTWKNFPWFDYMYEGLEQPKESL